MKLTIQSTRTVLTRGGGNPRKLQIWDTLRSTKAKKEGIPSSQSETKAVGKGWGRKGEEEENKREKEPFGRISNGKCGNKPRGWAAGAPTFWDF